MVQDIAGGHLSKNARQAVEVLSDYQNAAVDLLDLALEAATKNDKSLFDSFGFLFGSARRLSLLGVDHGEQLLHGACWRCAERRV